MQFFLKVEKKLINRYFFLYLNTILKSIHNKDYSVVKTFKAAT